MDAGHADFRAYAQGMAHMAALHVFVASTHDGRSYPYAIAAAVAVGCTWIIPVAIRHVVVMVVKGEE